MISLAWVTLTEHKWVISGERRRILKEPASFSRPTGELDSDLPISEDKLASLTKYTVSQKRSRTSHRPKPTAPWRSRLGMRTLSEPRPQGSGPAIIRRRIYEMDDHASFPRDGVPSTQGRAQDPRTRPGTQALAIARVGVRAERGGSGVACRLDAAGRYDGNPICLRSCWYLESSRRRSNWGNIFTAVNL